MRNIEYTLALRWVIGWTYFSAFWRRVALADKLDPEMANYIGIKFNHFLPHALGIKPIINHLLLHPEQLHWAMVVFTIIEGIAGLLMLLGLFTRLASIIVVGLAFGILLGSGWIGTTCLDEWQIGVLGISGGIAVFFAGSGQYSLDYRLFTQRWPLTQKPIWKWLGSSDGSVNQSNRMVLISAIVALFLTLFTNQVFHNGLWGDLHNKSVKPVIELTEVNYAHDTLSFDMQRTEGVDVYGAFVVELNVRDMHGKLLHQLLANDFKCTKSMQIDNWYPAKITPGKRSLVVPLGAKAKVSIPLAKTAEPKILEIHDVSGQVWSVAIADS